MSSHGTIHPLLFHGSRPTRFILSSMRLALQNSDSDCLRSSMLATLDGDESRAAPRQTANRSNRLSPAGAKGDGGSGREGGGILKRKDAPMDTTIACFPSPFHSRSRPHERSGGEIKVGVSHSSSSPSFSLGVPTTTLRFPVRSRREDLLRGVRGHTEPQIYCFDG